MHDLISQGEDSAVLLQASSPSETMGSADIDPNSGAMSLASFSSEYARIVRSDEQLPLAIWFIDIRNFRSINPQYGFSMGNVVLRTLVSSMRELLCRNMPVTRVGGDRFVALSCCIKEEDLQQAFDRFVDQFNERLTKVGVSQRTALYAGVYYLRPEDRETTDFNQYLDYASFAHRKARRQSVPGLVLFSDVDLERDRRRIAIERRFDHALSSGDIVVWFQPQIDYVYGEVVGAEALARWNDPELGWIGANEFVPVLESCGKIYQLDSFIWEEACRCASRWRSKAAGKPVPISVNLARLDLMEPHIIQRLVDLCEAYELPQGSIRLEIAESAFVEDPVHTYELVHDMRNHLLTIEMDSFGSGHISLDMFDDVNVDAIKLDMGFMRSATDVSRNAVVLSSMIRMMQELDMPIIAKGVETVEQAEMLKNMGCHLMQGYLFSHPLPVDEFEQYMASNRAEEHAARREHKYTSFERLYDIDVTSSFLFNDAMGPSLFFFIDDGATESILVNDQFYEACGFDRLAFGNHKVDLVSEIDEGSHNSLWRAVAEACEHGAAFCRIKVRSTEVWITGVLRFLGTSSRGDVYLLSIVRSSTAAEEDHSFIQAAQKIEWDLDLLNHIIPHEFIKCDASDAHSFAYVDQGLLTAFGLSKKEIEQHFHNSLIEMVLPEDRKVFLDAVRRCRKTGQAFSCDLRLRSGHTSDYRAVRLRGRIAEDDSGTAWLYALIESIDDVFTAQSPVASADNRDVTVLEYHYDEDCLIIHPRSTDSNDKDIVIPNYLRSIEGNPATITKTSAARVLSLVHDLRSHPSSGFFDVKCTLSAGEDLQWYHINYTCDSDEDGNTLVLHGYAQSANDEMGSVRWWREQAETDQLTSLLNRNAAELAINLSMRTQGRGIMFMIDMDSFKRVNDDLGHLAGDTLLRDVAAALANKFRSGDVLGRYGGDEFIAFMSVATGSLMELAERRARAIVEAIAAIDVGDGTHAACSVGVAISTNREATFYDLLGVADDAMYQSKERGKGTYTILTVGGETIE